MPRAIYGAAYPFLPRSEILSFEEIARVVRLFVDLGVGKLRLTGGEPLLRRDLHRLVAMVSPLPGLRDFALTTNGSLLAEQAAGLREAGLHRVTVSLDSLDPERFAAINDTGVPVARVLAGIEAAHAAGFSPVKINMVVKRGVNEADVIAMAQRFRGSSYVLRFIEYMDVGATNGWQLADVIPAAEIIETISRELPLEPLPPNCAGETARRFRHAGGGGEIGIIASVSQPFCGGCSRARMTADGRLYPCLFASRGLDLREPLRAGCTDEALRELVHGWWNGRRDRYSEERVGAVRAGKVEMSRVGG